MRPIIRRPTLEDRAQWEPLWKGYLVFYKEPDFPPELTELLWQRIHDIQHPIECFLAEDQDTGELIGLVHYFPHTNTWKAAPVCYLQDLFVSNRLRSRGIGASLIQAVVDDSNARGWVHVYWQTEHDNKTARGLYDKLTGGTDGFVTYRIGEP